MWNIEYSTFCKTQSTDIVANILLCIKENEMELKDFIAETLKQIIEGAGDAQIYAKEKGASINPELHLNTSIASSTGHLKTLNGKNASTIEFDVAVTATEGTGTKGGIGIIAGAINLGSSGQTNHEKMSVSNIKFSVPLSLPNA